MLLPVQVTIKDIPTSKMLETHILKNSEKLKRFFRPILSCRVVVQQSQKHKHQGKLYSVHIDTAVPGKHFVITKKTNEDIYVVLRDAFKALERKLLAHAEQCGTRSQLKH